MIGKECDFDVIQRPGLAYQYAFDWLAGRLYSSKDLAALVVNQTWHAAEMMRRLRSVSLLAPAPDGIDRVAEQLGVVPPAIVDTYSTSYAAIGVIATSQVPEGTAEVLMKMTRNGGCLHLILGGRLARFVAEHNAIPTDEKINAGEFVKALQAGGFQGRQRLEIQKPKATSHHYLGQIALKGNRRDLQDRRHFAMRRDYVSVGRSAGWSGLVCLTLERIG